MAASYSHAIPLPSTPTANTDKSAGLWPRREITAAGSCDLNKVLNGVSHMQRIAD
jgi:hypothetical protein